MRTRSVRVIIEEADALYKDGRYEAAATKYAAIVHADPKNHLAAYRLGESLLNLHRPKESVGFFTAAKESPDLKAQALQGIGLAFIQLGDPAIAEERLQEAMVLDDTLWPSSVVRRRCARPRRGSVHPTIDRRAWSPSAIRELRAVGHFRSSRR